MNKKELKMLRESVQSLKFEIDHKANSLCFFWGTIETKPPGKKLNKETKQVYDKKIRELYKDFARTILLMDKMDIDSSEYKLIIKNAKMQLRRKEDL